jgi:NusA-like KH domain protein
MTMKTFDMQFIRYINLFSKVTKVEAKHCFSYNNMLVFVVPKMAVDMAVGRDAQNLKKLSEILGKRIRVLGEPKDKKDMEWFLTVLVNPVQFEKLEVKNGPAGEEMIITAGGLENRSMLIGRGRARENELKAVVEQYFGIKILKIV